MKFIGVRTVSEKRGYGDTTKSRQVQAIYLNDKGEKYYQGIHNIYKEEGDSYWQSDNYGATFDTIAEAKDFTEKRILAENN